MMEGGNHDNRSWQLWGQCRCRMGSIWSERCRIWEQLDQSWEVRGGEGRGGGEAILHSVDIAAHLRTKEQRKRHDKDFTLMHPGGKQQA